MDYCTAAPIDVIYVLFLSVRFVYEVERLEEEPTIIFRVVLGDYFWYG